MQYRSRLISKHIHDRERRKTKGDIPLVLKQTQYEAQWSRGVGSPQVVDFCVNVVLHLVLRFSKLPVEFCFFFVQLKTQLAIFAEFLLEFLCQFSNVSAVTQADRLSRAGAHLFFETYWYSSMRNTQRPDHQSS